MSGASAMATKRLRKELVALQKDPPPGIIAQPDESNILVWYYAIQGPPATDYHGGVYVGKLKFPTNYPMGPPSIMMLTPSGRFQTNTRLCMSMSDFHRDTWNPMWSVGTILQGIVSFMTSEEVTTGGLQASSADRQKLATVSQAYNDKHWGHLFHGNMSQAFEQANVARQKAEAKRLIEAQTAQQAAALKTKARVPKETTSDSPSEQTNNLPEELTQEQKERRRLKNAKKRAKQKAKKASQATSNNDGEQQETTAEQAD